MPNDKLKMYRGDMSLREAAEKLGISHMYLSNLEKGIDERSGKEIKPSFSTLRKISDAYNVNYINLLNDYGYITNKDVYDFLLEKY